MAELFTPNVLIALAITVGAGLATVIGSFLVVFARHTNTRLLAFGLAFAAGAMVYVSLVEIFVKSQHAFMAAMGSDKAAYALATAWFFAGVALLLAIDRLVPNPHASMDSEAVESAVQDPDRPVANVTMVHHHNERVLKRVGLMAALAITAHNLPEGLATFFATLENPTVGLPLAAAIAIHNIPEGVSIAVPVFYATRSKWKAILASAGSGLAEPVGALAGYLLLAPFLSDAVFGAVFGVIAGAMVFLSLDELLPAARRYAHGHETVYGMVAGMAIIATSLVLFR
ncbi:zinc transporter ZupT [Zhengella mangrovi]|uniref:Zinc transporter ZupT n=1 Tax=Zhengella mangrovi TaxID=1982044 RepID=A0A2G1QSW2_9HYPH|nr:zinc transporter ZupT [Zhengella mangrovi]PHP68585.1 zinc transporter ZupT [Zhengella mangrovi]